MRTPQCRPDTAAALEERQDRAALQLAADNHLTSSINSEHLEDRLGDIETNCRDRPDGLLL
jgi:hypothetical protein